MKIIAVEDEIIALKGILAILNEAASSFFTVIGLLL